MQICRVGQNHTYTVFIRYFWQGNHQIYGVYTVYIYGSGQPYKSAFTGKMFDTHDSSDQKKGISVFPIVTSTCAHHIGDRTRGGGGQTGLERLTRSRAPGGEGRQQAGPRFNLIQRLTCLPGLLLLLLLLMMMMMYKQLLILLLRLLLLLTMMYKQLLILLLILLLLLLLLLLHKQLLILLQLLLPLLLPLQLQLPALCLLPLRSLMPLPTTLLSGLQSAAQLSDPRKQRQGGQHMGRGCQQHVHGPRELGQTMHHVKQVT